MVQAQTSPGIERSELWRDTTEEMRARLQDALRDVEARIRRLSEEMQEDARKGGEIDRMIESQRRIQQMQLRQREVQALQEMLNGLSNIARTLETFGESQQQRASGQRRTVRDRIGWHVVSISSAGGTARAELWSETGGRVSVRVGSRLPNGMEVSEISSDGVMIRKEGEDPVRLEMADMAFLAMRIGQLSEEHQAGLRTLGMGGFPPGFPGVPPVMPMPGGFMPQMPPPVAVPGAIPPGMGAPPIDMPMSGGPMPQMPPPVPGPGAIPSGMGAPSLPMLRR